MDSAAYEVLSMAMRYVFTLIGVMMVWRTFSWLRKDRKRKHRRLRQLPDAGCFGNFVVLEGNRELKPGSILPVPHEGNLGYLRTCDVVVPISGVADAHLDFAFVNGEGLYITPMHRCSATVDGQLIRNAREGRQCPMQHGSLLQVGQALLQLEVFAGFDVQSAMFSAMPMNLGMQDDPEPLPEAMPERPSPAPGDLPFTQPIPVVRYPADPYTHYMMPSQGVPPTNYAPPAWPPQPMNQPPQGGDRYGP